MTDAGTCCGSTRWSRALPWLIFLLGLYTRTFGLSHDLDAGYEYNPDTQKQMMAAVEFVQGHYYFYYNQPEIDGYPYFNGHLLEYLIRIYDFGRRAVLTHMGVPPPPLQLDTYKLLWPTRVMNATLSALSVLLVYFAALRFVDPRAAVLASLLLAISPIDLSVTHHATGDATTSFFATCALYYALAIYRRGHLRDYVLGAFFAAASCSAKHHGGLSFIPLVFAHGLRYLEMRRFWSVQCIARFALLGATLVVGILLTTPSLLVAPWRSFKDILAHLHLTSNFGMRGVFENMPVGRRFLYNMERNPPVFYNFTGPVVVIGILAGLVAGIRRRAIWVAALAPAVYLFVALWIRPKAPANYLSLVTASLFLAGAAGLAALTDWRNRKAGRIALAVLAVPAVLYLAEYTRREMFYWGRTDTRRLADSWAQDNIPKLFTMSVSGYNFNEDPWNAAAKPGAGHISVTAGRHTVEGPGVFPLNRIVLENKGALEYRFGMDANLSDYFRNRNQSFFACNTESLIRSNFTRAVYQPQPTHPLSYVLLDAPHFLRSPLALDAKEGQDIRHVLVSAEPVKSVLCVVRNGLLPSRISLSLGGSRRKLQLASGETRILSFDAPKPMRAVTDRAIMYKFRLGAGFGGARVTLATREDDKLFALYNAGDFAAAYAQAANVPLPQRNLSTESIRMISGLACGRLARDKAAHMQPGPPNKPLSEDDFLREFGIAVPYLHALPYRRYTARDIEERGFDKVADAHSVAEFCLSADTNNEIHFAATPSLALEPGAYVLRLRLKGKSVPLEVEITDSRGTPLRNWPLKLPAKAEDAYRDVTFPFTAGRDMAGIRVTLAASNTAPFQLDEVSIRPDALATVNDQLDLLRNLLADAPNHANLAPADSEVLVARGDVLRDAGQAAEACTLYLAAVAADGARPDPYRRLEAIRPQATGALRAEVDRTLEPHLQSLSEAPLQSVKARFRGGVSLTGFRLGATTVPAGGALPLNLYWDVPRLKPSLAKISAWVHLIDPASGLDYPCVDHALFFDLMRPPGNLRVPLRLDRLSLHRKTTPGKYKLQVGLWIPKIRRTLRVGSTDLPHERKSVFLAEITVE